jgi:hypothetical protein
MAQTNANGQNYDHTWETKSVILPYVKRDHAYNFDEHDNTNWAEYKADTPKAYEEDMDYQSPHPTPENTPASTDPEDEFVRCQANAVGHFKHAKSPDEKRFYMK